MLRYLPYAFIWLLGIPFLIWFAVAPKITDDRFWQVDAVSLRMGSSQVMNPSDGSTASNATPPSSPDATNQNLPPAAPADVPLSSLSAWPDDGVKIKPVSPDLQENSSHGPIPRMGADGTKPWQYYARPFPADNTQPRLAIILRDTGLSDEGSKESLRDLPGEIAFAFSPYADNLEQKMQAARDRGHETLLQLPLEAQPGSGLDVGPRAYSSEQTPAVNQDNYTFMLSKLLGSVGVITNGGQRFVNNETFLQPLMQNLSDRGLVFVDDTLQNETLSPLLAEQMKAPWARTLLQIDENLSPEAVDVMMGKAVALAKQNGRALVVAGASPLTRSEIANWTHRLQREGVVLAPLTAVVTIGSAGQPTANNPPAAAPAVPGALMPRPDNNAAPATSDSSSPDSSSTAPIDLLNPKGPGGAPAPNILDPSKPIQSVNPTTPPKN